MKLRVVLATAALGAAALLGLTACGQAAGDTLSPDATALTAVGFTTDDLATSPYADPQPSASGAAATKPHPLRPGRLRRELARHVLHGEVVVQTKDGDKTIDVQRGTVTAVTGTTVTVKSPDGFTGTWAFGDPLRVVQHGQKADKSAVKTGEEIGVAGVKNGSTVTANLIVIPKA
jgi:hypothetical protein